MTQATLPIASAGLGLRREFAEDLLNTKDTGIDFLEVAPENWMSLGGNFRRTFTALTERFPMMCHGLSLSIGGPAPLDEHFLRRLKRFFDEFNIVSYSEHLSYCGDQGHLYDLMPIPFTEEAIHYVSARIRRVQDILERPLIIENVSYYAAPGQELDEIFFIKQVLEESDCALLLDVNNVYVNSINHNYSALNYIKAMPTERISYLHMAGHYNEAKDLIVDTHGADITDPVWQLLAETYQSHGNIPTLLERDFNIPSLAGLLDEMNIIKQHQNIIQQKKKQAHG
ncbi:MAG TPA: DUF692 domain-containing protein [Methylophaga aminisulfidivorans]|uniref:UPF0276 protein ENI26_13805 n=2 Tax=root TaxID=1 RepID=A0A7C1VTN2_9GAMM|nr:DUF692 domain-containing protein [Methylophaga aminisulfidivorans]